VDDLFPETLPQAPSSHDRILIGTSGYSFRDWVGPFYPPSLKPSQFLPYYARHFACVEVNATYYRIPTPDVIERMERKTPPGFRFVVKLHRTMTHDRDLDPNTRLEFLSMLEPLKAAGKYDGLLAQFPWGFQRAPANQEQLQVLRDRLPGEPLFVEFRHRSWITPGLADELRSLDLGYCAVDEPALTGLVPPVVLQTTADGYVRFHGRNAANWWGRSGGDRYDYDYKENELREWLKKITQLAEQARRTYLFFNSCHAGQAARNASLMQELLRQQRMQG